MATTTHIATPDEIKAQASRSIREFAFHGYAVIVARKHNLVIPSVDLSTLSQEDFEQFFAMVRDLAHLPPG